MTCLKPWAPYTRDRWDAMLRPSSSSTWASVGVSMNGCKTNSSSSWHFLMACRGCAPARCQCTPRLRCIMRLSSLEPHSQRQRSDLAQTSLSAQAEGGTNIVECHGIGFDGVDAQLHEGKKARFEDTLPSTHKPFKFDRSKIFK